MREGIKGGQLKILSDDQINDTHLAILNLLENVGLRVESDGVLRLLNKNGCRVDFNKKL